MTIVAGGVAIAGTVNAANQLVQGGRNAKSIVALVRGLISPESKWLKIDDGKTSFTVSDISDIHTLLASPRIAPLIQVAWADRYVDGSAASDSVLSATFKSVADVWCGERGTKWSRHADKIWDALSARISTLIPRRITSQVMSELDSANYIVGALANEGDRSAFTTSLLVLAADITRLQRAHSVGNEVSRLAAASPAISLTHLDLRDEQANRDSLYVDRSLEGQDATLSTQWLAEDSLKRIAILGQPGAGKSTLSQNLTKLATVNQNLTQYVVLGCKDYSASHWDDPLAEALWKELHTSGLNADCDDLHGALLLGRIGVIFDAIDEVTRPQRRQQLVDRINKFAIAFPLTSIIVTSREVDYNRTPLNRALFERARLREFTWEQVAEYAKKWFTGAGTPNLLTPFMSDCAKIRDIAVNPLILSLLCNLYRARGHIPTNRHSVYRQCADLLYKQWDRQRQIEVNEDHPDYGSTLMESIAYFFWSTPSAIRAEEGQLEKIIAVQLQSLGIRTEIAEERARGFLDFCKGRLWLLTESGATARGIATFEFAHRTFQEFFTAEYLAKRAVDARGLADVAIKCFEEDSSSLLPELLIQSYDGKRSPGASAVYGAVAATGNVDLELRLLNSNIPAALRGPTFSRVMDALRSGGQFTAGGFEALIAMHEEPREQFINSFLMVKDENFSRFRLAELWYEQLLRTGQQDPDSPWCKTVQAMEEEVAETFLGLKDEWRSAQALEAVLGVRGFLKIETVRLPSLVFARAFGSTTWGFAFRALTGDSLFPISSGERRAVLADLAGRWRAGAVVQTPYDFSLEGFGPLAVGASVDLDKECLGAAVGLAFVAHELKLPVAWIASALSGALDVSSMMAVRDARLADEEVEHPLAEHVVSELRMLPDWAPQWVLGRRSLTRRAPLRTPPSGRRGDLVQVSRPRS
jgi:hypothetical protein